MKRYTIGLITGVLLTASALMFMGAMKSDKYDHDDLMKEIKYLRYVSEDNKSSLCKMRGGTANCQRVLKRGVVCNEQSNR